MKKQLAILLTGTLLVATGAVLTPVKAETNASFYCGQSYDPLSKKNIPTTLVTIPGRQEPIAFIRWKSEFFAQYVPQQRCNIVSPKFQAAYQAGELTYVAVGQSSKTGQSIICGLASQKDSCDDPNMLFTLKPYTSGQLVLSQLMGIVQGDAENPIYESSGRKEIVNVRAWLKSKR